MPKEFSRARRVAETLQRELAEIIRREVTLPRAGLITVSAVDVSPDLHHAKVFVTALGNEIESREVVEELNHAGGFMRHELARHLNMRVTPQLHFFYDTSLEYGQHLSALIDQAVAEDSEHSPKK